MENLASLKKAIEWLESDKGKETRESARKKYDFYIENREKAGKKEIFEILEKAVADQPEFDSLEKAVAFAEKHATIENQDYCVYMTPPQASNTKWLILPMYDDDVDPLAPGELGWVHIGNIRNDD